ncbi:MAG: exo-alpha-sialidase [Proteobacteria bacterium]|nr:exo-alpha-sialidase [Pseudomonadota bacterium]
MIGVAGSRKTILISLALAVAMALSLVLAASSANRAAAYPNGWTSDNTLPFEGVVWIDTTAGRGFVHAVCHTSGFDIYYSRSGDQGVTWSAPAKINTGTSENPAIEVGWSDSGKDYLYIAYETHELATGRLEIVVRRSEDDGATWVAGYNCVTNGGVINSNYRRASLSNSPTLGVQIVYEKKGSGFGQWDVFLNVVYPGLWGTERKVNPDNTLDNTWPAIDANTSDDMRIVYLEQGTSLKCRQWTGVWGAEYHVATSLQPIGRPDIVFENTGIFAVVWDYGDAAGNHTVRRRKFESVWSSVESLYSTGLATPASPRITAMNSGVGGGYHMISRNSGGDDVEQLFDGGGNSTIMDFDALAPGEGQLSVTRDKYAAGAVFVAGIAADGTVRFKRTDVVSPWASGLTVNGVNVNPGVPCYVRSDFTLALAGVADDWKITGIDPLGDAFTDGVSKINVSKKFGEGGPWEPLFTNNNSPWTSQVSISGLYEGSYFFRGIIHDTAGNQGVTIDFGPVVIDYTKPVTSATYAPPNANGFYNSSVEVTLDMTDVNPKDRFYRIYKVGASPGAWQVYTSPFTVSGDNDWRVQYYSDDLAGNCDSAHIFTVNIDTTFPVTSLSTDTAPNANGWRDADTELTLTNNDLNSQHIYYRTRTLGGTWGTQQTYSLPFTIEDGEWEVEYYSTDLAGNEETHHTEIIRIDSVNPNTNISSSILPNDNGWINTNTQITLTINEQHPDETNYRLNGGSWQEYLTPFFLTGDGIWEVEYYSSDIAGNSEPFKTLTCQVDKTDPITSLSSNTTTNENGWRDADTKVTLLPSDNLSNVDISRYRLNGGSWQTYSSPFLLEDGEWTVEYYSTDLADNEETHKTGELRIDKESPSASINTNTTPNSKNWRNKITLTTLSCTDTNPHTIMYQCVSEESVTGGGNWAVYSDPFDVPDGTWEVKYYSIDKAGNESPVGSLRLNVDTYAPVCFVLKPEKDSVQTGFTSEQMCEVTGLGNDENGIDYQRLSVSEKTVIEQNREGEMSYIWDVGNVENGVYEIKVEAVDPAGNSSSSSKNISLGNYCRDWYFAEGNTLPEFDQFFCIQNPGDQTAKVTFNFMLETGETVTHDVVIGPQTRSTYNIKEFVEEGHHVSTHIRSDDQAIIAERPMYFNYKNSQGTQWKGGHIAMGLNSLQKEFYFAEGTTRRNDTDGIFDEWLTIQNPSDDTANVKITHMLSTGENIETDYKIIPHSRYTVNVPNDVGLQQDVSTKIESDVPIAAERPMYFDYHGFAQEGHNVVGIPSPSKTWYFAEGSTQAGFEEWITIQNPNNEDAKLKFKYMTSTGEIIEKDKDVSKRSRYTVDVPMDAGKGKDISVEITSDLPVVCERPMYFNYKGKWAGGTDVMGAITLSDTFYIAEGTTIENFDTYYTAANPSNESVVITVKYMFGDGKTEEKDYTIEAHSRLTINVNSEVGGGKDVSSEIKTSGGSKIMVERPMYFDYHGMSGGHVVNAYGVN